ncbi:MAG: hypothetical protein Q7S65_04345 [Nanoarchaeota archaeon]|nr:hypothetical protein [Nanoarchaeota archaeon]
MKFKIHVMAQLVVFLACLFFLSFRAALLITLFHFIPSFDFLMKKLDFHADLHRKLTHNLFVAAIASFLAFRFAPDLWAALASLNLLLHLLMDCQGMGVELLYPASEHRFKLF